MRARDWRGLGCAALIGAAAAFPAGVMFASREPAPSTASKRAAAPAERRDFYSPKVTTDPYVMDQQRKLVEALEMQCRQSGANCAEAKQARRWIDKQDRSD